jgi:hypothetical protein
MESQPRPYQPEIGLVLRERTHLEMNDLRQRKR